MAEARGSLKHALALKEAPGAPAGRRLSQLCFRHRRGAVPRARRPPRILYRDVLARRGGRRRRPGLGRAAFGAHRALRRAHAGVGDRGGARADLRARAVSETRPVWPASAALLADWPRRAEAWDGLRRALALNAASGAPAGRSLSQVVSDIGARGDGAHGRRQCQWADGRDPGPPLRRVQGRRRVGCWGHRNMTDPKEKCVECVRSVGTSKLGVACRESAATR